MLFTACIMHSVRTGFFAPVLLVAFCFIWKVERLHDSDQNGDVNLDASSVNGGNSFLDDYDHLHSNEKIRRLREMDREHRQNIVLWKKPLVTLQYFTLELIVSIQEYWRRFVSFV